MKNLKNKFTNLVAVIKHFFPDSYEREFIEKNSKARKEIDKSALIVLLQMPMDHYYLIHWKILAEKYFSKGQRLVGIWPHTIYVNSKHKKINPARAFIERKCNAFFWYKKWEKLYAAIGIEGVFVPNCNPLQKIKYWFMARSIFNNLKSKRDVLTIKFEGLECGDLIYDTYIRFRNYPTVDLNDRYLLFLIYKALLMIQSCRVFFSSSKVESFFSSYSSYIQHGIPVRVALEFDISVYTDGTVQAYCHKINEKCELSHELDYVKFPLQAEKLLERKSCREKGKLALQAKFLGHLDQSLCYMKQSSYKNSNNFKTIHDLDGVIFLPDFLDSPHVYRWMLFSDFFEWIHWTLAFVLKHKLKVAVKPHPNQLEDNAGVLEYLKKSYPDVYWVSSQVSNKSFFQQNIHFGLSVYGTVLHELAYHNIVPIAAGDHQAISYDFIYTPKTIAEYGELILSAKTLKLPKKTKEQVSDFYYMYALHNHDALPSKARNINLRKLSQENPGSSLLPVVEKALEDLSKSQAKAQLTLSSQKVPTTETPAPNP